MPGEAAPFPTPKLSAAFCRCEGGSVSVQGGLGRCCSGRGFPRVPWRCWRAPQLQPGLGAVPATLL